MFAYPSQLPPSHPTAPPEHLKEPLAYMRKAQVRHVGSYLCHVSLALLLPCFLPAQIRDAVFFFFFCIYLSTVQLTVCVCCLTQAGWEKRVLISLNSMSTELEVPLARMVATILSLAHECTKSLHLCSLPSSVVTPLSCFIHEAITSSQLWMAVTGTSLFNFI